ncbi:MAG: porin [Bacteroidota bacterium]|nr:porin [Bacteroidota bacterium]|tara:strand:+ start:390 stop:1694 length:1305 start_codon:yes stop_codon:yes gene_type:complete
MKKLSLIIAIFISTSIFSQNISLESYKFGEGLQFNADRGHSIRLTGYAQPMIDLKNYTDVEENSSTSRYRIRRLRLRIDGKSKNQKFGYRFQADLSGTSETGEDTGDYLLDAYVSYAVTNRISILFGQRATYTDNRELFMNSNSLQLVERSRLTSAFSSIREFGLFITGRFRAGRGSYLRPYFVLTNGDGINVFDKDHGGLKIGGRLDYLPFGLFTNLGQFRQIDIMREQAPKLVLGVHFSHNSGMSSRRGRASGAIIYLDENNQESLPDYTKYGFDFLFKYKGFSAIGEYIKSSAVVPDDITQRVRNDGSISSSFLVDGMQNIDSYVKGRMMLGQAYNFQMGYLFKSGFSIDTRFTHLDADENSFLNNATFYNRPNYYTLGIGKLLAKNYGAKIQASITYVDGSLGVNHDYDTSTDTVFTDEILFRLITTISF